MPIVTCPSCQQQSQVAENWSGVMFCSRCDQQFAVRAGPQIPVVQAAVEPTATAPSSSQNMVQPVANPIPVQGVYQPNIGQAEGAGGFAPTDFEANSSASSQATTPAKKKDNSVLVATVACLVILVIGVVVVMAVLSQGNVQEPAPGRSARVSDRIIVAEENLSAPATVEGGAADRLANPSSGSAGANRPQTKTKYGRKNLRTAQSTIRKSADSLYIRAQSARNVLKFAMNCWKSRLTPHQCVAKTRHLATVNIPEWNKMRYDLASYEIETGEKSDRAREYYYKIKMSFHDQQVEDKHRIVSVRADENDRWIVAPIRSPE